MSKIPSQFDIDLAAICGTTPKNNDRLTALKAQAKTALNITTPTRSLSDTEKQAILDWHKKRLADDTQLDIESIAPAAPLNEPTTIIEQVETITPGIDDKIMNDVNDALALINDTAPIITDEYDQCVMVQFSIYVGARDCRHVSIEGEFANGIMTMAGISKKDVPAWIQSAVDNWGDIDTSPKANITKQIRCLIVRLLTDRIEKLEKQLQTFKAHDVVK